MRRSSAWMKMATLTLTTAYLLLAVVVKQGAVANPSEPTIFGIKESEMPGHYVNLFFGGMDERTNNKLLTRVNAFVWAKGIRDLAEILGKKIAEVLKAQAAAKSQQRGKRGGSGSKKNIVEPDTMATTKNKSALQSLLKRLTDMENDQKKAVTRQTFDSLKNIWAVFKAVFNDVSNFGEIDVEAMIEEHKKVSSDADWERDGHIWKELAPLHMKMVKTLLLSKNTRKVNDNELANAFKQWSKSENHQIDLEIFQVKYEMRSFVGMDMFRELEMEEPLLLRLDIAERWELQRLYRQMFSNRIETTGWKEAKQQLEIRFLFGNIVNIIKDSHANANSDRESNEKEQRWVIEIHKLEQKIFTNLGGQTFQEICDKLAGTYVRLEHVDMVRLEELLKETHKDCLITIGDGHFRHFLDATPGARARLFNSFDNHSPTKLMEFDLTLATNLDKLAAKYHELAVANVDKTDDCKLKHLKARVNVDVLLQLILLEHFLLKQEKEGKTKLSTWWDNFRNRVLLFLDNIVDASQKFAELYVTLLNNMLYRFRLMDTLDIEWDQDKEEHQINRYLVKLDEISKREVAKKRLDLVEHPLEPEKRAEWLSVEHRLMVKKLVEQADTEAKRQLRDLTSKQMKQLAKTLNDGPNKAIEWENWLNFIKQRKKQPQFTTGQPDPMKQAAEQAATGKGKAPMVEEEKQQNVSAENADEMNDKELFQMANMYLQAIADESTELERLKAKNIVDLLVQFISVDEFYTAQTAKGFPHDWAICGTKILDYLQQLATENWDQEWIKKSAVVYGNMLYKLRCQDAEKKCLDMKTEGLLTKEYMQLEQLNVREQKGKSEAMTTVEQVEAEVQKEWLQKEHAKYIRKLKEVNIEFRQRLAVLKSNEKGRLEKLTGGKNLLNVRDENVIKNQHEIESPSPSITKKRSKIEEIINDGKKANAEKSILAFDAIMLKNKEKQPDLDNNDAWNDAEFLHDKLAEQYLQSISVESTALQLKRALIAMDVLIQVLWLDKYFRILAATKNIVHVDWTNKCRPMFVRYLRQLESGMGDEKWLHSSANLYGNMLYRLRWQDHQEHWEFEQLLAVELMQLELFKKRQEAGEELPEIKHIETETHLRWLRKEHANALGRLLEEDKGRAANNKRISDVSDRVLLVQLMEKLSAEKTTTTTNVSPANAQQGTSGNNENTMEKEENTKIIVQQLQSGVYYECPKRDGDSNKNIASEELLLTPYVSFLLMDIENAELDERRREANLDALNWHYRRQINQILLDPGEGFESKEPFSETGKQWNELLREFDSKWSQIPDSRGTLRVNSRLIHIKEQSMCKFHHFLVNNILENNEFEKTAGSKWTELLKRVWLEDSIIKWMKGVPIGSCDDLQQHAASVTNLLLSEHCDVQRAHSEHLDWLIWNYEHFRCFLCDRDPKLVKGRLLELINPQALDQLEIKYPEVLKIGQMHPKVRLYLYSQCIGHRSDTPEAQRAELRLASALLVDLLNQLNTVSIGDPLIDIALMEKTRWLKEWMFRDWTNFVSKHNVCLMERFADFVDNLRSEFMNERNAKKADAAKKDKLKAKLKAKLKVKKDDMPKEMDIWPAAASADGFVSDEEKWKEIAVPKYIAKLREWTGEECQMLFSQDAMLQVQRLRFSDNHREFIFSDEHTVDVWLLIDGPGERARLRKLAPNINFAGFYDRHDFSDNIQLRKQIHDFFFSEDADSSLAANLGVNFIVWSRWMEAKLDGKLKSWESELMMKIWHENQPGLLEKFDEIFDQNSEELEKGRENWARIQHQVADLLLVDPNVKESEDKQIIFEYEELLQEVFTDIITDSSDLDRNAKQFESVKLSIAIRNREELLRLLSATDQEEKDEENEIKLPTFKKLLLNAFKDHPEAKKRLPELVGAAGVKPVAKALGWKSWDPKEFGLTTMEINSAEKKEKLEKLRLEKLELEKAEKVKMSEKSVDEIAKELESLGGNTVSKPTKQKASKKKGTKTNSKMSHLSSGGSASSSSDGFSPTGAKAVASLLTTHESETSASESTSIYDEKDDQNSTVSESTGSEISIHQEGQSVITKSSKNKKKSASKLSKTSRDSSFSVVGDSEFKESEGKLIVDVKSDGQKTAPSLSTLVAVEKQKLSSGMFKRKIESAIQKWRRQAEVTEPLLEILRKKGVVPGRPSSSSDTSTGLSANDTDQSIEFVIKSLKNIVHSWKKDAILLVGGSYLLQLNTADSDFDCILLLPFEEKNDDQQDWNDLYVEHYFGNQIGPEREVHEVLCNLESKERYCATETSLYCMLCKDLNVTLLQKRFGRNNDPMILMQFHGIQFDISFVPIPNEITVSDQTEKQALAAIITSKDEEGIMKILSSVRRMDKLIAYFIDWWKNIHNADGRKGMLWALSGYRANLRMRDLLKGKPIENFRSALLTLKLWAKNNFVYGAKFGLLNGSTLTIVLLHVFLENLHDSIPSLLAKFFSIFSQWKWPKPLELQGAFNEKFREKYGELDWNERAEKNDRGNQFFEHLFLAEKFVQLVWPVILPGFPTQNPAFNVNLWTSRAMLKAFNKAFIQMDQIQKAIVGGNDAPNMSEIRQQWDTWFYGGQLHEKEAFHEKYGHFVAIFCAAHSVEHVQTFCDYVESRIRLQLIFSFGDLKEVQWMHASPERIHDGGPCPPEAKVHLPAGKWFCTSWLVGIQLVEGMEQDIREIMEQKNLMEFRHLEHSKNMSRLESFAEKISADFDQRQKQNKRETLTEKVLSAKYISKKK